MTMKSWDDQCAVSLEPVRDYNYADYQVLFGTRMENYYFQIAMHLFLIAYHSGAELSPEQKEFIYRHIDANTLEDMVTNHDTKRKKKI